MVHFTADTLTTFLCVYGPKKLPNRRNLYWLVYLTVCSDLVAALEQFGLFPDTDKAKWPGLSDANKSKEELKNFVKDTLRGMRAFKATKGKWYEYLSRLIHSDPEHSSLASFCLAFCSYLCRAVAHTKAIGGNKVLKGGASIHSQSRNNFLPKLNLPGGSDESQLMSDYSQFQLDDKLSIFSFFKWNCLDEEEIEGKLVADVNLVLAFTAPESEEERDEDEGLNQKQRKKKKANKSECSIP